MKHVTLSLILRSTQSWFVLLPRSSRKRPLSTPELASLTDSNCQSCSEPPFSTAGRALEPFATEFCVMLTKSPARCPCTGPLRTASARGQWGNMSFEDAAQGRLALTLQDTETPVLQSSVHPSHLHLHRYTVLLSYKTVDCHDTPARSIFSSSACAQSSGYAL